MTETSFALYRKYRPHTFSEVRNQDHIVRVLQGAIEKGKIPHALLFTGSRGTGKTTVARIFAHAIGAHDVDIYEIDAASNRGIDDIRALKEAVHTLPYESPYKVYIIDEVHMLTKEAFNALLKTLEEPPSHVIFILATTEQDKLLDTILSRCQIFNFRAPTRDELSVLIQDISKEESVTIAPAGAHVIALAANGSYRDALSIMQKVLMTSADAALTEEEIARIVGAPRAVHIVRLLEAVRTRALSDALRILEEAESTHIDHKLFLMLLIERIRAILLVRHGACTLESFTDLYDDERTVVGVCAKDMQSPFSSRFLERLLRAGERVQFMDVKMLPLELALIETLGSEVPQKVH